MVTDSLYEPYIDEKYKKFASSLSVTDTMPRKGIRIPLLRKLSKEIDEEKIEIKYHEDVILKGLAIGYSRKTPEDKIEALSSLLPYLSSWDQTDTIASGFKVNEDTIDEYYRFFSSLLKRKEVFIKRLAIVWLMSNRRSFKREKTLELILSSDDEKEYYISMAVAWAFSLFVIDNNRELEKISSLSPTTQLRAKQKLRDSRRFFNPQL